MFIFCFAGCRIYAFLTIKFAGWAELEMLTRCGMIEVPVCGHFECPSFSEGCIGKVRGFVSKAVWNGTQIFYDCYDQK
jgi:hypothetical protein